MSRCVNIEESYYNVDNQLHVVVGLRIAKFNTTLFIHSNGPLNAVLNRPDEVWDSVVHTHFVDAALDIFDNDDVTSVPLTVGDRVTDVVSVDPPVFDMDSAYEVVAASIHKPVDSDTIVFKSDWCDGFKEELVIDTTVEIDKCGANLSYHKNIYNRLRSFFPI